MLGGFCSLLWLLLLSCMAQGALLVSDWWLAYWVGQSPDHQKEHVNALIYGCIVAGTLVLAAVRCVLPCYAFAVNRECCPAGVCSCSAS